MLPERLVVSVFLYISTAVSAFADSQSTIRFSTVAVPPWGYIKADSTPAGYLIEVERALESVSGFRITNHVHPHARVIAELSSGKVDFAILIAGPRTSAIGIPVGDLTTSHVVVVGRKGAGRIYNLNELTNQTVGYIRGTEYGPEFDRNTVIRKVPVHDMVQGIRMLLSNRIDSTISTEQAFLFALRETEWTREAIEPRMIISALHVTLYFSKRSTRTHFLEPMRTALLQLKRNGVLDRIFEVEKCLACELLDSKNPAGN